MIPVWQDFCENNTRFFVLVHITEGDELRLSWEIYMQPGSTCGLNWRVKFETQCTIGVSIIHFWVERKLW